MHGDGGPGPFSTSLVNQGHDEPPGEGPRGSLWSLLDDRLRGRWRIAIALGCVLGLAFASAAYLLVQPKYQSVALIRIAPDISPVLAETIETGMLPMYQSYVTTQAELIQSRRVLERALADENLAAFPWTKAPDAPDVLKKGLTVSSHRLSELITVQYAALSPIEAQAGVNAIVSAYNEIYGGSEYGRKLETLRGRRLQLRQQIRDRKSQVQTYVARYGTDALQPLLNSKIQRLEGIDLDIERHKHQISYATAQQESGSVSVGEPGILQMERLDPRLADLYQTRDQLILDFESAKRRFLPGHREYVRIESELAIIDGQTRERENEVRKELQRSPVGRFLDGNAGAPAATLGQLEMNLGRFEIDAERCRDQIKQISADQARLTDIQQQLRYNEQDLAEFDSRIMHLEIESEWLLDGRITIAAHGDRPISPSRDRRRKLAVVGLVGGFCASFGIFFLLGSIDRRAFAAAQLREDPAFRWLGVLPDMSGNRLDADSCAMAAHCVHQLRNRIEARHKQESGFVLAVSSPYQGDGKTGIVMALGCSYAASGNETLLVDCDITGQSLSRQMSLGDHEGLRECLRNGYTRDLVVPQRIPNLSVLAAGVDREIGPESIKRRDLETVFEHLRRDFDVIIVDTGPMLASLEGLPVASSADGVILSVRRGRRRPRLQECITSLDSIGANYLGVVLNYADRADCNRYASKSSLSSPPLLDRDADNGSIAKHVVLTDGQNPLMQAMRVGSSVTDHRVGDTTEGHAGT